MASAAWVGRSLADTVEEWRERSIRPVVLEIGKRLSQTRWSDLLEIGANQS